MYIRELKLFRIPAFLLAQLEGRTFKWLRPSTSQAPPVTPRESSILTSWLEMRGPSSSGWCTHWTFSESLLCTRHFCYFHTSTSPNTIPAHRWKRPRESWWPSKQVSKDYSSKRPQVKASTNMVGHFCCSWMPVSGTPAKILFIVPWCLL